MKSIIVIAHNLRSTHNVGSLLRTAEGLGITEMYLTGYTPYPALIEDERLPHIATKLDKQIAKTALGAEKTLPWHHVELIDEVLQKLSNEGYKIIALEQSQNAVPLPEFNPPAKVALIVGREVEGIEQSILEKSDDIIEIPMRGKKESFNVVQAAAMALYHISTNA